MAIKSNESSKKIVRKRRNSQEVNIDPDSPRAIIDPRNPDEVGGVRLTGNINYTLMGEVKEELKKLQKLADQGKFATHFQELSVKERMQIIEEAKVKRLDDQSIHDAVEELMMARAQKAITNNDIKLLNEQKLVSSKISSTPTTPTTPTTPGSKRRRNNPGVGN